MNNHHPLSKAAPCPFCNSKDLGVIRYHQNQCAVECEDCDGRGPIVDGTSKDAVEAWNRRAQNA